MRVGAGCDLWINTRGSQSFFSRAGGCRWLEAAKISIDLIGQINFGRDEQHGIDEHQKSVLVDARPISSCPSTFLKRPQNNYPLFITSCLEIHKHFFSFLVYLIMFLLVVWMQPCLDLCREQRNCMIYLINARPGSSSIYCDHPLMSVPFQRTFLTCSMSLFTFTRKGNDTSVEDHIALHFPHVYFKLI